MTVPARRSTEVGGVEVAEAWAVVVVPGADPEGVAEAEVGQGDEEDHEDRSLKVKCCICAWNE